MIERQSDYIVEKINSLIKELSTYSNPTNPIKITTVDFESRQTGELSINGVSEIQNNRSSKMLEIIHSDCDHVVVLDHYAYEARFLIYHKDQEEPIAEYK